MELDMPIPENPKPYYLKDPLENAIDEFAKKDRPSQADMNKVIVEASVQSGLDKYRKQAETMSRSELRSEKHDCSRLARFLVAVGKSRPSRCQAHAIVSGSHKEAAQLRAILAWLKLRIDDPDNGCWLPENTAATPHPSFSKAVPHSRIHRYNYYAWLNRIINFQFTPNQSTLRKSLKLVGQQLQEGTFPPYVMLPKGKGI